MVLGSGIRALAGTAKKTGMFNRRAISLFTFSSKVNSLAATGGALSAETGHGEAHSQRQ